MCPQDSSFFANCVHQIQLLGSLGPAQVEPKVTSIPVCFSCGSFKSMLCFWLIDFIEDIEDIEIDGLELA